MIVNKYVIIYTDENGVKCGRVFYSEKYPEGLELINNNA